MGSGVFEFRSCQPTTKAPGALHPMLEQWQQICQRASQQQEDHIRSSDVDLDFGRRNREGTAEEDTIDAVVSPWCQALLLATLSWPAEDPQQIRALHRWLSVSGSPALIPFWDLLLSGFLAEDDGPGWMVTAGPILVGGHSSWRRDGRGLSLLEWWEKTFYPQHRKQYGVFHTPHELAEVAWSQIPSDQWQTPESGWILDPAAGTQVFACAALSQIARKGHTTTGSRDSAPQAPRKDAPKLDFMQNFLSRFSGIEKQSGRAG